MPSHAGCRNGRPVLVFVNATAHQSVRKKRTQIVYVDRKKIVWSEWSGGPDHQSTSALKKAQLVGKAGIKLGGHPVVGQMIFFGVEVEEADAKAQVDREIPVKFEVILKVRLNDLVALMVCALRAVLSVSCRRMRRAANLIASKEKQIGKNVARGVLAGSGQEDCALHVACIGPNSLVDFSALSKNRKDAELKRMFAKSESGIVPRAISWIRMAPRHVTRVNV